MLLLVSLAALQVARAHAERGLLSPSAEQPAIVQPGDALTLSIEAATGLTPPPGLQEERAHRSFAVTLCATGVSFGAPVECCFPLRVRNVRPLDGASLRYRVEAALPSWVAPGDYRLLARFPGGEASRDGAVLVMHQRGRATTRRVRVHVGAHGIATTGAPLELYPLPAREGGLALGLVALVPESAYAHLRLAPAPIQPPEFAIVSAEALSGRPTVLRTTGAPQGSHVFWWLGQERGAEGPAITTLLHARKEAVVEALLITREGAVTRARRTIPVAPRYAFSCSASTRPQPATSGYLGSVMLTGLLAVAVSRKLRGRRRSPARE